MRFDERVSERDGNDNIYMYSVPYLYIYIYIMPPYKSTVVSTCRSSVNFARRNRIYLFFLKYLHKTLAAHVLSAYRILSRKRRRGKTFRDVAWSSVYRSGRVPIYGNIQHSYIYLYLHTIYCMTIIITQRRRKENIDFARVYLYAVEREREKKNYTRYFPSGVASRGRN